ncbi:MAG: hypothetical protein HUU50_15395 [Candidatus Brocadiae bacterium]|nr:hypothetical protein [Candidatus Brocadiia bacterium]
MITKTPFANYDAVELRTQNISLVVVSGMGPRIASFRFLSGDNILYWDNSQQKGSCHWKLMGGHRVWVARPGADESPETYLPDNEPCEVKIQEDSATIFSSIDPILQTRRGIAIKAISDNKIQVDHFLQNCGTRLYSASIWALTCTLPGQNTQYALPLGDSSSWDTCTMVLFKKWDGHGNTEGFGDPQFSIKEDMFLVHPKGMENKRMIQSHKGIMAMSDPCRNFTFIKKFDYCSKFDYPLGCNSAIYIGPKNFMVEMETMGGESTLKPGEILNHRETWLLLPSSVDLGNSKILLSIAKDNFGLN